MSKSQVKDRLPLEEELEAAQDERDELVEERDRGREVLREALQRGSVEGVVVARRRQAIARSPARARRLELKKSDPNAFEDNRSRDAGACCRD